MRLSWVYVVLMCFLKILRERLSVLSVAHKNMLLLVIVILNYWNGFERVTDVLCMYELILEVLTKRV